MLEKMSWDQLKQAFPDEWIAVVDYKRTGALAVEGLLVAHHPNKKTFHDLVAPWLNQYKSVAVRYTGQLIKNPEVPLLWQILNTSSMVNS